MAAASTAETLQKYIAMRKASQKGFSLRSLAKRVDVSPSFLSRVLNGQKAMPEPLLEKLADILQIESEVVSGLKRTAHVPAPAQVPTALREWDLVETPGFAALRQWFYLPVLELTTLANFDGTTESIARRLTLAPETVEVVVRELISAGLLTREPSGRIRKSKEKLRWGTTKSIKDIRCFHDQMMAKAQEQLRTATSDLDLENRLITGITVSASPERIASAKQKLTEFLHELANELTSEPGTEVFHLAAQLFPLTKVGKS